MKIKYSNSQKGTSLAQNTSNKRRAVKIHPPARLAGEPKKKGRTEGRKEDTRKSGKLAIRPDHPRRRIKITLCMVGGLRCVVIRVKCNPNRLKSFGAVGVPITLASMASGINIYSQLLISLIRIVDISISNY